jgi:threonyl-tRNA synthetase
VFVPVKSGDEGILAVSGGVLKSFLSTTTSKNISCETNGALLKIKSGEGEVALNTTSADDFPVIPKITNSKKITIDSKVFLDGLRSVFWAASVSTIKPELSSVYIKEEAPGMVFWHPKGWTIYTAIETYMRKVQRDNGYQEIKTPQVVDRSLWERSGHWDKFQTGMFTVASEQRDYAIKPMNCPCHIQVFNQGLKSYRDLPLRLAEFGSCHRNEASGTLQGLMRVRSFVQDDAHIFCSENMIQTEVSAFTDLLYQVYADFGFSDVIIRLSTRPEQRVGSDEVWDKAEQALADALNAKQLPFEYLPGEGAFYGPKIEFSLKDCIGRVWQCGTIQVDFSMPARLDAQFVAEDGSRQVPVMLHRAILGSFERFIGILIEHYEGAFPTWLAPEQVAILNITDNQADFAQTVAKSLQEKGFRAFADLRNEKIGFKIREHTIQKVPYLLILGDQEVASGKVSVRTRTGTDLGTLSLDDFLALLTNDVANKSRVSH